MCCKVLPGNDTRGCPSCLLTFGPVSVPTIDTFGCARFHPFGNGKPQKRAGPATRERRKPWRRRAPTFPESVIHRELVFQVQSPRQSRQRILANQLRRG